MIPVPKMVVAGEAVDIPLEGRFWKQLVPNRKDRLNDIQATPTIPEEEKQGERVETNSEALVIEDESKEDKIVKMKEEKDFYEDPIVESEEEQDPIDVQQLKELEKEKKKIERAANKAKAKTLMEAKKAKYGGEQVADGRLFKTYKEDRQSRYQRRTAAAEDNKVGDLSLMWMSIAPWVSTSKTPEERMRIRARKKQEYEDRRAGMMQERQQMHSRVTPVFGREDRVRLGVQPSEGRFEDRALETDVSPRAMVGKSRADSARPPTM
jgi:hypothetical protein